MHLPSLQACFYLQFVWFFRIEKDIRFFSIEKHIRFFRIEKDIRVTTESALGLIGGTMGLFTGHSITKMTGETPEVRSDKRKLREKKREKREKKDVPNMYQRRYWQKCSKL